MLIVEKPQKRHLNLCEAQELDTTIIRYGYISYGG